MDNYKLIKYLCTFNLFWSLFCGLQIAWGGRFENVLGGRLNLAVFVISMFLYMIAYAKDSNIFCRTNKKYAVRILSAYIFIYLIDFFVSGNILPGDLFICSCHIALFVLLNDNIKIKIANLFIYTFCTLYCVSLIEYLLYVAGAPTISTGFYIREGAGDTTQYIHQLIFNNINIDYALPRFQGLCEEAGQLGTICFLLLFCTGNDIRYKYCHWLIWIFGIFSFSLGFYILSLFYIIAQKKFSLKFVIVFSLIFATIYHYYSDYFDILLVNRVSDKSLVELNNRSGETFDMHFFRSIKDGSILLGHGGIIPANVRGDDALAGIAPWLYKHGALAFCLLFSAIYTYVNKKRDHNLIRFWEWLFFIIALAFGIYKSTLIDTFYTVSLIILYPILSGAKRNVVNNNTPIY